MTETTGTLWDAFGVNPNDVDENPFSVPKNAYKVVISSAEVKEFKDIPYFVIQFDIADGPHAGKGASDMHRMIPWTPAERDDYQAMNARALTSFKKALLDLGMPEGALAQFNPRIHGTKLVGIKGTATIGPQKNRPEYNAISNFSRGASANSTSHALVEAPEKPVEEEKDMADLLGDWSK